MLTSGGCEGGCASYILNDARTDISRTNSSTTIYHLPVQRQKPPFRAPPTTIQAKSSPVYCGDDVNHAIYRTRQRQNGFPLLAWVFGQRQDASTLKLQRDIYHICFLFCKYRYTECSKFRTYMRRYNGKCNSPEIPRANRRTRRGRPDRGPRASSAQAPCAVGAPWPTAGPPPLVARSTAAAAAAADAPALRPSRLLVDLLQPRPNPCHASGPRLLQRFVAAAEFPSPAMPLQERRRCPSRRRSRVVGRRGLAGAGGQRAAAAVSANNRPISKHRSVYYYRRCHVFSKTMYDLPAAWKRTRRGPATFLALFGGRRRSYCCCRCCCYCRACCCCCCWRGQRHRCWHELSPAGLQPRLQGRCSFPVALFPSFYSYWGLAEMKTFRCFWRRRYRVTTCSSSSPAGLDTTMNHVRPARRCRTSRQQESESARRSRPQFSMG